jgi:hypothetical protein
LKKQENNPVDRKLPSKKLNKCPFYGETSLVGLTPGMTPQNQTLLFRVECDMPEVDGQRN